MTVELNNTYVIRTDDENFKEALGKFLSQHCTKESNVNAAVYELNAKGAKEVMEIVMAK
ncbi:hypothetical protein [Solibacillus sp.]|uniref:hypothetical protein n=1 Tax=Solibacillus sp. TaxID=1909654 RepID=UPI003315468C